MTDAPLKDRVRDLAYREVISDLDEQELEGILAEVAALEQERARWEAEAKAKQVRREDYARLREAIRDHVNAKSMGEAQRTYNKLRRIARLTEGENDE